MTDDSRQWRVSGNSSKPGRRDLLLVTRGDGGGRLTAQDAEELRALLSGGDRWRAAFEALHARVHRGFNFDAAESAAPDDEYWARLMDDLVTYADEVHPEIEAGTAPADTDNERQ